MSTPGSPVSSLTRSFAIQLRPADCPLVSSLASLVRAQPALTVTGQSQVTILVKFNKYQNYLDWLQKWFYKYYFILLLRYAWYAFDLWFYFTVSKNIDCDIWNLHWSQNSLSFWRTIDLFISQHYYRDELRFCQGGGGSGGFIMTYDDIMMIKVSVTYNYQTMNSS